MDDNELYDIDKVINYHINQFPTTLIPYEEMYQIAYLGYIKAQRKL